MPNAARAYKDINLWAMKLLAPGGHLLTFSCSGAVSPDLFQKIVAGAAADARVDAQVRRHLGRLGRPRRSRSISPRASTSRASGCRPPSRGAKSASIQRALCRARLHGRARVGPAIHSVSMRFGCRRVEREARVGLARAEDRCACRACARDASSPRSRRGIARTPQAMPRLRSHVDRAPEERVAQALAAPAAAAPRARARRRRPSTRDVDHGDATKLVVVHREDAVAHEVDACHVRLDGIVGQRARRSAGAGPRRRARRKWRRERGRGRTRAGAGWRAVVHG